jgi:hypothetical protein
MNLWFHTSQGHFAETFDTLAALPKPRRAVCSFLGLTAVIGLAFVFGIAAASDFAGEFGIYLSNMLSFNTSGILAKPMFWGIVATVVVGYLWLLAMIQVRKFAGWLGGETAGDL